MGGTPSFRRKGATYLYSSISRNVTIELCPGRLHHFEPQTDKLTKYGISDQVIAYLKEEE
jgi:hypothetical protein